jgi:hypothetical protein
MMEKRLIQSIVIAAALILLTVGAMPEAPKRTGHTTAGAVSHIVPTLSDFTTIEERAPEVEIAEEPEEEPVETVIEEPQEEPVEETPVESPVYAPQEPEEVVVEEILTEDIETPYSVLNKRMGVNYFNGQKETYYNLRMTGVIRLLDDMGIPHGEYWIRDDGAKMLGDYIMIATDTNRIPKGTIWETSLGTGMIVDHCSGSESYPGVWIDVAVNW